MTSRDLVVRPWEGMQGLRSAMPFWRDLQSASGIDPLCNAPEWVLAHAEAFSEPASIFGWTLSTPEGLPVAILPFRHEPSRGAFALRRAILVADGTYDSDYLDLPIRPGFEEAALRLGLGALAERRDVEVVVLGCVPLRSPALVALRRILDDQGLPARELSPGCCAAPLPQTFEEYLKGLKRRMRSKVRSAIRNAEEKGAVFTWCHDPVTLEEDLEGLYQLHSMRWQAADQAGSFASPERRRFYGLLVPQLLAMGALRFAKLELEGRPVAYQIGASLGGTYYQLQEGYHTDYAEQRVAVALRGMFVRRLIDEGTASYDFMAGMARHKTDWGARERACTTLAFPLPRLRPRLAYAARALLDRLRRQTDPAG